MLNYIYFKGISPYIETKNFNSLPQTCGIYSSTLRKDTQWLKSCSLNT